MNMILLFDEDFTAGESRVRLHGRRLNHVLNIHRATAAEVLKVGLCGGKIGVGKVITLDEQKLEMDVSFDHDAPPALPVTLALALPRPLMLKRVLACLSAMGVKKILLFHSRRVEKSFWKSPVLADAVIREQLILGLEQAGDTIMPQVKLFPQFKPFVEDELLAYSRGTHAFVAHPGSGEPCPANVKEQATLVIGPEGGLIPYEVDLFCTNGFKSINIGKRTLRVESAVPALLAKMFY